jgi:hypothetical protein
MEVERFLRVSCAAVALVTSLLVIGCKTENVQADKSSGDGVTDIAITNTVLQTGIKHLGINIGGQNFYDSGQMLRNLIFINPGFEGETWGSILRCEGISATTCSDPNQWNQWPENFLKGAQFEVISGAAAGVSGTVLSSDAADSKQKNQGVAIHYAGLSKSPELDDFVLVKQTIPGNTQAGWWTNAYGGGSFATEFADRAPGSPGKQALKILASGPGQAASVASYFDSVAGHSFVQLTGKYHLSFRAKGLGGNREVKVNLRRVEAHGDEVFLSKIVSLSDKWSDYNFDFLASENGKDIGTVGLTFDVTGADVLLDDVSLSAAGERDNPTAFRDEVVETLRELHPGILRYQDGDHLGSSIDNLIAAPFARVRAGFSEGASQANAIPLGLQEFLQLCQAVGAEPWFNMPAGISPVEMKNLVEYLSGPASNGYGARRAARGQAAPWTSVFPVIHLELGNEEWNNVTFAGSAMPDPVAYGQRAKKIFLAARSSPYYAASKFDLVIGSFASVPGWTQRELANSGGYDSAAVAPYLFNRLDDASSEEAVFGPMLAEPEMLDSVPTGYMAEQTKVAQGASRPAALSVYEVNLSTTSGAARQADIDGAVPSMGAGLALIDHMLLMMRDLGIKTQNVWSLPGYENQFQNSAGHQQEKTPLFGVVVDMGGATNLRRPQYLAEQLVNAAILPTMLQTRLTGANPTWEQQRSGNGDIKLDKAHYLQTFAFADGAQRSLIVLNLSRTDALPLTFSGDGAPSGNVMVSRLGANKITDSNEVVSKVAVAESRISSFKGQTPYRVPPFSMTVFRWTVGR